MFSSFTATLFFPNLAYHMHRVHAQPLPKHHAYLLFHSYLRSGSPLRNVLALFKRKLPRHSWIRNQLRHAHTDQW